VGWGIRDGEWGVWDVGCGMWDGGCGISNVGCGMWDVGCGMWDVGCRMWDVGCGMWDVIPTVFVPLTQQSRNEQPWKVLPGYIGLPVKLRVPSYLTKHAALTRVTGVVMNFGESLVSSSFRSKK